MVNCSWHWCVCKFGHLSGETANRHNGPNKGLPTASPLSLLYYNVIKVTKMGPHRVFPIVPTRLPHHPRPPSFSSVFAANGVPLRRPPAHPCPPLGGPQRPVDGKLPRRFPRLFPQHPISPQYDFAPLPPWRGRGIQFPFSWCSPPAM